jgi:hypothetical protein
MESIITLISSVATLIVALTALVKIIKQNDKVKEIHLQFNSRMDEFLKLTKESSFAKGVKSETDKQ